MSFEIEKKFLLGNFDDIFKKLKIDFGNDKYSEKRGFWWCNNHSGSENMLDIQKTLILKKDIEVIKDIGEFNIPVRDYQYIRLRILNTKKYFITIKNKSLVNNIEENIEYEFIVDKEIFKRISMYLKDGAFIFYYNIKKTWEFLFDTVKIEVSKLNDLRESYMEVEVVGENENKLKEELNNFLKKLYSYELKEETKNYAELSHIENQDLLKKLKLLQYSTEGYKILYKLI